MTLPSPCFDRCLVTGASAGLGRVFAERLAPRARVLTLTARREDRLRALAAELTARHPGLRCPVVALDLAAPGAAARLAGLVAPPDLLVNNAGFGKHGPFADFGWDDWGRMLAVNVVAPTELMHAFWRQLTAQPGRGVINVASAAGFQPIPWFAVYAATKAYLRSVSLGLSAEARAHGTRILSVCPGPTATEFGSVAESDFVVGKRGMTAESVVDLALRAYAKGRREVVTGVHNAAVAVLAARLPLRLVLAATARYGRRRSPRP